MTCGYAVEYLRSCYQSKWRLPEAPNLEIPGRYYFNDDADFYPGVHCFGSRNWTDAPYEMGGEFGEIEGIPQTYDKGGFPVTKPDPIIIGTAACLENGEQGGIAPPPQVWWPFGVNPDCWLAGMPASWMGEVKEKTGVAATFSYAFKGVAPEKQGAAAIWAQGSSWTGEAPAKEGTSADWAQGSAWTGQIAGKEGVDSTWGQGFAWTGEAPAKEGLAPSWASNQLISGSVPGKETTSPSWASNQLISGDVGEKQGPVATIQKSNRLWCESTNTDLTCDIGGQTNKDLGTTVGTGSASASTASTSFVQRVLYDKAWSGISGTYKVSLNCLADFGTGRFRLQVINAACAVVYSSAYSSEFTSAGVVTLTDTLAWPSGGNRLRIAVELKKTSGVVATVTVTHGASSYVDAPV